MTNSANFIHPRHHAKLTRGRIILKKGNVYINREDGEQYELVEYLDENAQVLIRNLHTRQCKITSIYQLENVKINEREDLSVDLSEISDEYWEKALERYEMIKPLLERDQPIKDRAAELGVSERSLYRWLNAYNALGSVAGLVERKRGWLKGNSRLTKEQDELVTSVINEFYLHKQRPTMEQTIREVQRVASQKGIKSPCRRTISLRIMEINRASNNVKSLEVRNDYKPLVDKAFKLNVEDNMTAEDNFDFLDQVFWVDYQAASYLMENFVSLLWKPKRAEMPNIFLVGEKSCGKSALIERFFNLHGIPFVDSKADGNRPIILAKFPNKITEKELYISLLESFYIPYDENGRTISLRNQAIHLMGEFKVKMLVIDDMQNLLNGTAKTKRTIMNAIKTFCDELQIPFIGVGDTECIKLLDYMDIKYRSRFNMVKLPQLEFDTEFQHFLSRADKALPLNESSHLSELEVAQYIHRLTDGSVGKICQMLKDCAKQSIENGIDRITIDQISNYLSKMDS